MRLGELRVKSKDERIEEIIQNERAAIAMRAKREGIAEAVLLQRILGKYGLDEEELDEEEEEEEGEEEDEQEA